MTTMTFLEAVNRMLKINGFIRGDTDTLAAFTDTNHASTSSAAQIAVQNEITELSSKGLLPYQHKTTGSISLVNGTRTYDFESDFVQLWGDEPFFYDATSNMQIRQYPGGEEELRSNIYTYRTQSGYPMWFYFELGTGQQVSFYPVPGSAENGRALAYDYSASVNVSASSDTIPFATVDQQYAFVEMAARRFKFLFEGKTNIPMDTDPVYREARSRLFSLLKWKQQPRRYGRAYLGGGSEWVSY
jgi:hypothetical protein